MTNLPDDAVTTEEFDNALLAVLEGMTAAQLLSIPGVYEVVSEELNNEAIRKAQLKDK